MVARSRLTKETFDRMKGFDEYLTRTLNSILTFFMADGTHKNSHCVHRWTKEYKNRLLNRLYNLNSWVHRHHMQMGMMSLTVKHSEIIGDSNTGYTDEEILDKLKGSWDLIRQSLNKMNYQFYELYEPHMKTDPGIAHIHVLIIGQINDSDIERLRKLWVEKYDMGNEHAFDFTVDKKETINHLASYLMKYMSKTITDDVKDNDGLMRFHSLFWATGYRMWSSSRYLTFVMRMLRKGDKNVIAVWITIDNEKKILWEKSNEATADYGEYGCMTLDKCFKKDKLKPQRIINHCAKWFFTLDYLEYLISKVENHEMDYSELPTCLKFKDIMKSPLLTDYEDYYKSIHPKEKQPNFDGLNILGAVGKSVYI